MTSIEAWYAAVDRGDLAEVRALIADVPDDDRSRAMYRAVDRDSVALVQELVAHGAELTYLLSNAISDKAEHVARWVLAQRPGDAASDGVFAQACGTMSIELLELLLAHGASVADKYCGWTALAIATREKRADVVAWLVSHEAPVRGWLFGAAATDDLATAKRALEAGDDLAAVDDSGMSALIVAAHADARTVAAWIIEQLGAATNTPAPKATSKTKSKAKSKAKRKATGPLDGRDSNGLTAIAHAAGAGHLEMVRLLADAGAALDPAMAHVASSAYLKNPVSLAIAELLLDRGAKVDARQESSQSTALIEAAEAGWLELVELLLSRGASLHLANIIDTTALSGAAWRGHADVVKRLLDAGARLKPAGEYGRGPLESAIESGAIEIVRLFLQRGGLGVRARTPALFVAAEKGPREIVELLLEHGADVDQVDDSYGQDTALRKAAGAGHRDIVALLIERGAREPGLREGYDVDEYTAIRRAGGRGHVEVVELLAASGLGDPRDSGIVTGVADTSDDPDRLERAIALAPDVDAPGQYGWLALHRAADRGHARNVRVLLDHGADPNRPDKDGKVPYRIASDRGHHEIVALLEARGAKLELVELIDLAATGSDADVLAMLARPVNVDVARDGRRALHAAAEYGRTAIVTALLERGAEIDAIDGQGWTALMEAADMGHLATVELLLDRKAAPFVADRQGFTAFTLAEEAGRADVVALLRARSADVDPAVAFQRAIDSEDVDAIARLAPLHGVANPLPNHRDPLAYAARENKARSVTALLAAGAEVDRELDSYGQTALYHAAEAADLATVRALLAAGAKPRRNGTTLRAVWRGEAAVVGALLDAGFDIDELQGEKSLLEIAIEFRRTGVVRLLIDRGISLRGKPGASALSRAAWTDEHAAIVEELLAKGTPVDGKEYSLLEKIEAWLAAGRTVTLLDPQAALAAAVWHDRRAVIDLALAQGADPNAKLDGEREPPILRAASSLKWELVEHLLRAGANPNTRDDYRSVAQRAAADGQLALLEKLAAAGARLDGCIAAMLERQKLPDDPAERQRIAALCVARGDDLDASDGDEDTPLVSALRKPDAVLARQLVELGASVNAPGKAGVTPLMAAAASLPLVTWLLDAGADLHARTPKGATAVHHAARAGAEPVVDLLLARGAAVTGCLSEAAKSGNVVLVERLLAVCELEEKDSVGWTAAMNAAHGTSKKLFELLLDRGASVEKCGTAAAWSGNKAHLAIALKRGAHVDARNNSGRTALMCAVDNAPCLELLVKEGASLDLQDDQGCTALIHAARYSEKKAVKILLAAGANRGLRDNDGKSAADHAHYNRDLRELLEV